MDNYIKISEVNINHWHFHKEKFEELSLAEYYFQIAPLTYHSIKMGFAAIVTFKTKYFSYVGQINYEMKRFEDLTRKEFTLLIHDSIQSHQTALNAKCAACGMDDPKVLLPDTDLETLWPEIQRLQIM